MNTSNLYLPAAVTLLAISLLSSPGKAETVFYSQNSFQADHAVIDAGELAPLGGLGCDGGAWRRDEPRSGSRERDGIKPDSSSWTRSISWFDEAVRNCLDPKEEISLKSYDPCDSRFRRIGERDPR